MFDDHRARRALKSAKVSERQARLAEQTRKRREDQQTQAATRRVETLRRWESGDGRKAVDAIVARWPVTGPRTVAAVNDATTFAGRVDGAGHAMRASTARLGDKADGSLGVVFMWLWVAVVSIAAFVASAVTDSPPLVHAPVFPPFLTGDFVLGLVLGALVGWLPAAAATIGVEWVWLTADRRLALRRAERVASDPNYRRPLHEVEREFLADRVVLAEREVLGSPVARRAGVRVTD